MAESEEEGRQSIQELAQEYVRIGPWLRRMLARFFRGRPHETDDVIQICFLHIHRKFEQGELIQHLPAFALKVAENEARKYYRKSVNDPLNQSESLDKICLVPPLSDDPSFEALNTLSQAETAARLLTNVQQQILKMEHAEKLSQGEIAQRLGLTPNKLRWQRTLIHRAIEKAKEDQ